MMEIKIRNQADFSYEISKCVKLAPTFPEGNPEGFFRDFKTIAKRFKWPEEH